MCDYSTKLHKTTQWLHRAGRAAQRRFITGVLIRCESAEMLKNVYNVIQVTLGKDFTYSRSRVKLEDMATSLERNTASPGDDLDMEMIQLWEWFKASSKWSRMTYLFGLLALCDPKLLHVFGNFVCVLLDQEKHDSVQNSKDLAVPEDDSSSVSDFSFHTDDHPELELLVQASSVYEQVRFSHETVKDSGWSKLKQITVKNLRSDSSYEKLDVSEYPAHTMTPRSPESTSGLGRHRDFIRVLPVNIAKKILALQHFPKKSWDGKELVVFSEAEELGLLDKETLQVCKRVSQHWSYLTEEILTEISVQSKVEKQAQILQGSSSSVINPFYARIHEVLVPIRDDEKHSYPIYKNISCFKSVYTGVQTKVVQMEERNVYCGVFNILVLLDRDDPSRVMHSDGGRTVALGSKDRAVRLLDVVLVKEKPPLMQGHAGSIRAVLVCEEKELVISASYDLSIRCWNLKTGACVTMFCGHTGTINCLDLQGNHLVSGARDCKVKVWNMQTGECCERMRFRHRRPVLCVKINTSVVLSGCEGGLVKMWNMETADLLKVIKGHQGSVKCLFFDEFHVLSGGSDGQVLAWSTDRDFKQCLITFYHPRAVLTLSLIFLRIITGCVDGNIRIFNFLNGDCLRVIKISSNDSPVLSLHTHNNTMLVNSSSRVLLLQFAQEFWDYSAPCERTCVSDPRVLFHKRPDAPELTKKRDGKSVTPASSHHSRSPSSPSMQLTHDGANSKRQVRERVNRGQHQPHPTTQVLLKLRPSHQSYDLATSNKNHNAVLRDSWVAQAGSPLPSPDPKAPKRSRSAPKPSPCYKGTFKIYTPFKSHCSSIPSLTSIRPWTEPPRLRSQHPQTACGASRSSTVTNTTTNAGDAEKPDKIFMRNDHVMKLADFEVPRKISNHLDPFRRQGGFQLRTDTEIEEYVQAQTRLQCSRTKWRKPKQAVLWYKTV